MIKSDKPERLRSKDRSYSSLDLDVELLQRVTKAAPREPREDWGEKRREPAQLFDKEQELAEVRLQTEKLHLETEGINLEVAALQREFYKMQTGIQEVVEVTEDHLHEIVD
ncbi:hypothetical protein Aduo_012080 [Ancylostoma duodenale]